MKNNIMKNEITENTIKLICLMNEANRIRETAMRYYVQNEKFEIVEKLYNEISKFEDSMPEPITETEMNIGRHIVDDLHRARNYLSAIIKTQN